MGGLTDLEEEELLLLFPEDCIDVESALVDEGESFLQAVESVGFLLEVGGWVGGWVGG